MLDISVSGQAVRIGPRFAVTFHRTLRIPDDGRAYPLPPGLGTFPIFGVSDYREQLPEGWQNGTAFIPMHRREALWMGFHGTLWKPNAIIVSVGGINALTGQHDQPGLSADPQNYLVTPAQPWLDGINLGAGVIRQFVAVPLGHGDTVEAALTGEERRGGIQITVFEPMAGVFPEHPPVEQPEGPARSGGAAGMGAGGQMRQKLYPDPYGVDVWDQSTFGRAEIYLLEAPQFRDMTGIDPPPTPVDAATYTEHGFPWFELYDDQRETLGPAAPLRDVPSVSERDAARESRDPGDESVEIDASQVHRITPEKPAEPRGTHRSTPDTR